MRSSNDDQILHAKRTFEAVSVFFLLEVLERIMTKIDLEMQTSGIIIKWQKLNGVTLFALINPHDTLQAVSEIRHNLPTPILQITISHGICTFQSTWKYDTNIKALCGLLYLSN